MSIFRNIKTIVVESAKAVATGVDLLSDAAEHLNQSMLQLRIQTQLDNAESRLRRQIDGKESYQTLRAAYKELSLLYRELNPELSALEKSERSMRYAELLHEIEQVGISEVERSVLVRRSLTKCTFKLAIEEISALQSLRSEIGRLAKLRVAHGDMNTASLIDEIVVIDERIDSLQKRREEIFTEFHDDGTPLMKYRKYDGLLDGSVQTWYKNGQPEFHYEYSRGKLFLAKHWHPESWLAYEVKKRWNELHLRIFISNGQLVIQVTKRGELTEASMWMWDGYRVRGERKIGSGKSSRLFFLLPIVFNLKVWYRIFKVSRNKELQRLLLELERSVTWFEELTPITKLFDELNNENKTHAALVSSQPWHSALLMR